jgi:GT2 family glycosyltransferase
MPDVTAVVLSYNRPDYLRESLIALALQTRPADRAIVVDNRSPASDKVAEVVAGFRGVELIRNAGNLGFTGGMNVGIAAATGKYVLLIEDDITADAECLGRLVACMESDPRIGLCGAVMFNRGDGTVRCAGGELSLGARYGKRIFGAAECDGLPRRVSYLPGALLLARRDDLRRWGGFRDDFFMYHEDDELGLRVLKEGRTIVVAPGAKVSHFDPAPGPSPAWLDYIKLRNFYRLYLLHAPAAVLPGFLARYTAWQFLREALRLRPRCLLVLAVALDTLARSPWLLRDRLRMTARPPGRALDGVQTPPPLLDAVP